MKILYQWCEANGLDPLVDVKRPHIELFGRHLETKRRDRPSSIAWRLILLKCFYRIAAADDYIVKSLAEHVRIPHALRIAPNPARRRHRPAEFRQQVRVIPAESCNSSQVARLYLR